MTGSGAGPASTQFVHQVTARTSGCDIVADHAFDITDCRPGSTPGSCRARRPRHGKMLVLRNGGDLVLGQRARCNAISRSITSSQAPARKFITVLFLTCIVCFSIDIDNSRTGHRVSSKMRLLAAILASRSLRSARRQPVAEITGPRSRLVRLRQVRPLLAHKDFQGANWRAPI